MKITNKLKKPLVGARQNWSHPLSRGLVGHWLFNEGGGKVAFDLVKRNNGTLTNTPLWYPGKFGTGLSFNGVSDYVDFGAGSNLNPTSVSFSVWIKANSFTATYSSIVTKRGTGAYCQLLVKNTGKIAIYIFAASGVGYDGSGAITLLTNSWYHLVLTYDSVAGLNGYVNGILDNFAGPNGNLASNDGNTQISNDSGVAGRNFDGLIDDFRVYNRALSQQEVLRLYQEPFADVRMSKTSLYSALGGSNTPFSPRAPYIKGAVTGMGLSTIKF